MTEQVFNRRDLAQLAAPRGGPCVSLYLPTHKSGREIQGDPIELKNRLRSARETLKQNGMREPDVNALLGKAGARIQDDEFWQHQSDGLAMFCAPGEFHEFRLPERFEPLTQVGERFYLKPLLPLLTADGRFFVLALSQSEAALYEATRHSLTPLPIGERGEMKLAPLPDWEPVPSQQFHSHRAPTQGRGDKSEAIYHGHGDAGNEQAEIEHFFRRVDEQVGRHLGGETAPLVLACVGFLAPIYESISRYVGLVKGKVPGSPHSWSEDELRARAWDVVQPQFDKLASDALAEFHSLRGKKTAETLGDVLKAAIEGRVATLFVEQGAQVWGDFNPASGEVTSNGDTGSKQELLDVAAVQTLTAGGAVFAMKVDRLPVDEPAAALLRY